MSSSKVVKTPHGSSRDARHKSAHSACASVVAETCLRHPDWVSPEQLALVKASFEAKAGLPLDAVSTLVNGALLLGLHCEGRALLTDVASTRFLQPEKDLRSIIFHDDQDAYKAASDASKKLPPPPPPNSTPGASAKKTPAASPPSAKKPATASPAPSASFARRSVTSASKAHACVMVRMARTSGRGLY